MSAGPGKKKPARGGRPGRPVVAAAARPWGMIAAFVAAGVFAAAVIGYAVWPRTTSPAGENTPAVAVTAIQGVADYRSSDPGALTRNHKPGTLTYTISPPVGGDHNQIWQNCAGTVYSDPLANEHAVHSLEHGAMWITYRPDLPTGQIDQLAGKVRGRNYTMLSPYPGLASPITLQAWGYQLAVESAGDARVDQLITATRIKAAPEPGATCSGGNTATGTTPREG